MRRPAFCGDKEPKVLCPPKKKKKNPVLSIPYMLVHKKRIDEIIPDATMTRFEHFRTDGSKPT